MSLSLFPSYAPRPMTDRRSSWTLGNVWRRSTTLSALARRKGSSSAHTRETAVTSASGRWKGSSMLFAFHLASGKCVGCTVTAYQVTASQALASLRCMTCPGQIPQIDLRDVDTCFVSEEFDHSPTNDEMLQAAETVASYFWREFHHCVDVTVEVLENN